MSFFVEGSCDNHALFGDFGDDDIPLDVRTELVCIGINAREVTFFAVVFKFHFHFADFPGAVALFARSWHIELAHREEAYCGICKLSGSYEVHNRKAQRADESHIADGKAERELFV